MGKFSLPDVVAGGFSEAGVDVWAAGGFSEAGVTVFGVEVCAADG